MSSPTITGTLKSTVSSELTAVLSPARTAMGAAVSPQPGQFTGTLGAAALRGYSAYDLAVKNGFTGTPEEWLASLKGADAVLPDFRASASHTGEPLSQPDVEVRSSGETVQFLFTFPSDDVRLQDLEALRTELTEQIRRSAASVEQYGRISGLPAVGQANVCYFVKEGGVYRWDDAELKYYRADSDYHEIGMINGNI